MQGVIGSSPISSTIRNGRRTLRLSFFLCQQAAIQRFFTGRFMMGRMKRIALVLVLLATAAAPQLQASRSIDVQRSSMTVYVYKQGLLSFLADNHEIAVPIAGGTFDAQRKTVELTVDAAKMRVLDPQLSADKRASVQSNMLGPQVLDVATYPTITFQSTSIDQSNGAWTVTGNLHLHGQTHAAKFRVQTHAGGRFTGSAVVRQTAFGITPIKVAGGAVSVKDDVRVDFDIVITGSP